MLPNAIGASAARYRANEGEPMTTYENDTEETTVSVRYSGTCTSCDPVAVYDAALENVFQAFEGAWVDITALVTYGIARINADPKDYNLSTHGIRLAIIRGVQDGWIKHSVGIGYMRWRDWAVSDSLGTSFRPSQAPIVAVNDHTCPSCRETRVSLAEKANGIPCWKCGNPL
jgi:hypothetical protein